MVVLFKQVVKILELLIVLILPPFHKGSARTPVQIVWLPPWHIHSFMFLSPDRYLFLCKYCKFNCQQCLDFRFGCNRPYDNDHCIFSSYVQCAGNQWLKLKMAHLHLLQVNELMLFPLLWPLQMRYTSPPLYPIIFCQSTNSLLISNVGSYFSLLIVNSGFGIWKTMIGNVRHDGALYSLAA